MHRLSFWNISIVDEYRTARDRTVCIVFRKTCGWWSDRNGRMYGSADGFRKISSIYL